MQVYESRKQWVSQQQGSRIFFEYWNVGNISLGHLSQRMLNDVDACWHHVDAFQQVLCGDFVGSPSFLDSFFWPGQTAGRWYQKQEGDIPLGILSAWRCASLFCMAKDMPSVRGSLVVALNALWWIPFYEVEHVAQSSCSARSSLITLQGSYGFCVIIWEDVYLQDIQNPKPCWIGCNHTPLSGDHSFN